MTNQDRHVFGQHGEHEDQDARRADSGATVQLREEDLAVRKQTAETGRVSIGTEVVEEQKTVEVPVSREEVTVERHAVDRRPTDEPISASSDEVLRVPVHEEQVSVEKQPVVYEEVTLGKQAVQETRHVSDTVRKEVVDVDAAGDVEVNGQTASER